MSLYSALARPALFALDPERAHDLTMAALRTPLAVPLLRIAARPGADPRLTQDVFGLPFRNPVGLAAGLDKQGSAVPAWAALGFGFAEIGTVTPRPQPGNPRPRLFRLPADRAIINRFGFNSDGAGGVAHNLSRLPPGLDRMHRDLRLGINLGRNKDTPNERAGDDYVAAIDALHPFADYFVINVSSPNTAGLRALQQGDTLRPLVAQVVARVKEVASRDVAVLVKVSPDMSESELLGSVDAAIEGGARGVIATNTTTSRERLTAPGPAAAETGGLSGVPLRPQAHHACTLIFRHLRGRVPIIGVGGIFTADDAYARVRAGASLVQVYTALVYDGPAVVSRIAEGVADRLRRDGFGNISEAVGVDVKQ